METKNHSILKTIIKIQFHHKNFELDQYQPIDKLARFHFNDIEFENECDTNS